MSSFMKRIATAAEHTMPDNRPENKTVTLKSLDSSKYEKKSS